MSTRPDPARRPDLTAVEALAEIESVVVRMGSRQEERRHGRAYFYAGDIYDDWHDLRAVLARVGQPQPDGELDRLRAENRRLINEKRRPDDWQDALITRLKGRAERAEARLAAVEALASRLKSAGVVSVYESALEIGEIIEDALASVGDGTPAEPTSEPVALDRVTGRAATIYTPPEDVVEPHRAGRAGGEES